MRIEGSVTAISWIPSDVAEGLPRHDSAPPAALRPDIPATLDALNADDRFRFANHLRAYVDFDERGEVMSYGQQGSGWLGQAKIRAGTDVDLAVPMPELRTDPEVGPGWVRFTQTWGGRANPAVARVVRRAPFVRFKARVAWSSLELTLHADGRADGRLVGASAFPRHWLYDSDGALTAKSGTADWKRWVDEAVGRRTPWGEEDSPALVTAVETALERELSEAIMRGGDPPEIRRLRPAARLTTQGEPGDDLFLVLDGVLAVEVDGVELGEIGPGGVVGERAVLEGGLRTATLIARTPVKVAAVPAENIDRSCLVALASERRRELSAATSV